MTSYYVTPAGSIIDDGLSPANAFDWASFANWCDTAALAGDVAYIDAGSGDYAAAVTIATTRDGTAADRISIIGVESLTTLAPASPTINLAAGLRMEFDNYWTLRHLIVDGDNGIFLVRGDINAIFDDVDVTNAGAGWAIYCGGNSGLVQNCRAECTLGVGVFLSLYCTVIDSEIHDSVTGIDWGSSRIKIIGNLIRDCTTGIATANSSQWLIAHNTFRDLTTAITGSGVGIGNQALSNIFDTCTASAVWTAAQGADTWDGNNWFNVPDPVNVTKGPNATAVDPNFVDPTAGTAEGFRVQTASLRNLGPTLYTIGGIAPSIFDTGPITPSPSGETDLSGDHYLIDGLETVLLDGNDVESVYRHRERVDEREPAQGVYLERNITFDFPPADAHYAGFDKPTIGGVVIDGEEQAWVILSVSEINQFHDYYGCDCRAAVLDTTYDLEDTITLFPGVDSLDEFGSRIPSHTVPDDTFTDIRAKIIIREGDPTDWAAQRQFLEVYDVYVAEDTGQLNYGDVIKDQDGKVYTVRSYRNRDHIGELSAIECELRNP